SPHAPTATCCPPASRPYWTATTNAAPTAHRPGADTMPKPAPAKPPTNASPSPASRLLSASGAAAAAEARDTGSNYERGEQLKAAEPRSLLVLPLAPWPRSHRRGARLPAENQRPTS